MTEIWKPVVGWEDRYEVSNRGRVYSHYSGGRFIRFGSQKSGHLKLVLSGGAKRPTRTVHSLVMEAFIGPRPEGLEARHLNGDPTDNRLENLEYATVSRNRQDRKWHAGTTRYILTPPDVLEIKRRLASREMLKVLARDYGVSITAISRIKTGQTHTDVGANNARG